MAQVITFEDYRPPSREDDQPWTQARVEEAATSDGSYTQVDTIDLDPVDTDPAAPTLRSFTTDNGTSLGLWYRVVFLDEDGNESQPTDPIQNLAATSDAFAEVAELAARLGLTFTADEADRAATLLSLASDVIRDVVEQKINVVTDDEYERPGTTDDRIPLPERPVVSVSTVAVNGTEISGWYVAGAVIVRQHRTGVADTVGWSSPGFGCEADTLTITYTHGYATVPALVKQLALEMTVRVWVNPGSVVQAGEGTTQTTYAPYADPPRGLMLTNAEKSSLRRFFGSKGSSVTVAGG